jgi:mutator protein MutT
MSLKDIQRDVDEWTKQFTPQYWQPLEILARLTEETGEFAREVNHRWGPKKKKSTEEKKEVSDEMADIIFTLCCMANSQGIDLDEAFNKMMDKLKGRDSARFERKDSPQIKKDFRVSVKSFIVKDNNVLALKRRADDPHKPNVWEIPGGRLELGENPLEGLKRETLEETGLDVDVVQIITTKHFVREDGQTITMLIYLCRPKNSDVRLSKEHTEFEWSSMETCKARLPEFFHDIVDVYNKLDLRRLT